jgi:thiamine-monophosphate kinase
MSNEYPSKEWQLINSIEKYCKIDKSDSPYEMEIGDDCAVRRGDSSKELISGDTLVEDVHFSLDYMTLKEVGFKAIASNISDIAAMGGEPDSLIVQIVFPTGSREKIDELYQGIGEAVKEWNTPVVGGDLSKGPCWMLAITVIGRTDSKILYRSGAKVGDSLWVTKTPGKSAIGLDLLQKFGRDKAEELGAEFVNSHIKPMPSIQIGKALSKMGVNSCLDISDGVLKEARTLAKESGVRVELFLPDEVRVELEKGASITEKSALHYFLNSGEEYGLIFSADSYFDSEEVEGAVKIGEIVDESFGVSLISEDGKRVELSDGGWDHL